MHSPHPSNTFDWQLSCLRNEVFKSPLKGFQP